MKKNFLFFIALLLINSDFLYGAQKQIPSLSVKIENVVFSPLLKTKEGIVFIADIKNAIRINEWSLIIKNEQGEIVKEFSGKRKIPVKIVWDGLLQNGHPAADGSYAYQFIVALNNKTKLSANSPKIIIDSVPPFCAISLSNDVFFIDDKKLDELFIFLSVGDEYKIDYKKCKVEVINSKDATVKTFTFEGSSPDFIAWNIKDENNETLPVGNYKLVFRAADIAGNESLAQTELVLTGKPEEYNQLQEDIKQVIYFEQGKYNLTPKSLKTLQYIVDLLKENQNKILITGYIDLVKSETNIKGLASNRAKSVSDFLISEGIDSGRIVINNSNSKRANVKNSKAKIPPANSRNRIAEITILK